VDLPGFGDAGQRAYGSAAFLCDENEDGNIISNLVVAELRGAPARSPYQG